MRVLIGPCVVRGPDSISAAVARALAGPDGPAVSLAEIGVRNLRRQLTAAEVVLLREALAAEDEVVGYVCGGRPVQPGVDTGSGAAGGPASDAVEGAVDLGVQAVMVTDHANLTWRSPLIGPNDDEVGPRFPSMTGVYASGAGLRSLKALDGIIVQPGVVAGVADDTHLSVYEADVARAQGHVAVSSELVPVVIVAAHMGLRVAAVVLVTESGNEGEG